MHITRNMTAMNDRTLNRLIVGLALSLVIGVPVFVAFYYFDRHVDAGPTQIERTIAAAEAAVRDAPNVLSRRLDLAAAYITAGRPADAVVQLDEVLKAEPKNRAALLGRGQANLALGKLDVAAADYQAVVDMSKTGEMAAADPQLEGALYNLGSILIQQGKPADAVPLLKQALGIDGGDADALLALGTALRQTGDTATAVIALRQATAFVPTGWCEPYEELQTAYEAESQTAGAEYAAGMLAFCRGQPEVGVAKLTPLTNDKTFAVDALVGLALIAEKQGDAAGARADYERALELEPANFLAVTGLQRVTAPGDDAVPHASQGPTQAPASPAAGGNG